jgi:hypothetical protein
MLKRLAVFIALRVANGACGSSNPASPDGPVQIAGKWVSTFRSTLEPQAIEMELTQTGSVVQGTYALLPSGFTGRLIDGSVEGNLLKGTLNLSRTTGSNTCLMKGLVNGPTSVSSLHCTGLQFSLAAGSVGAAVACHLAGLDTLSSVTIGARRP